jgi:tRNA nucleotidyltransferase/poly(A) polymerase
MNKQNEIDKLSCNVKKHSIETEINNLLDRMTPANIIDTMNQLGALTIKLKILKAEPDFTMNNRHDWGVREIKFQTT